MSVLKTWFATPVKRKTFALKVIIHLGAILPLINLYLLAFSDELGADPVDAVIHFTGIGALNLLLITLCITPLAKKFKQGFLLNVRRLLGLYTFTYALIHLLNFIVFELQTDLSLFISEVIKRPYITVGMVALLALLALAITSINRFKRSMGTAWQKLHNVIYLTVLLAVVHFYWSVKSDITEPVIYFVIVLFLLACRAKKFKRWFG